MIIEHDKTFKAGPDGNHKRHGVTIALVGDSTVDIQWAVNAMSIHVPVNAERQLFVLPHLNVDTARNIVIDRWRSLPPKYQTRHMLLWSANHALDWNTPEMAIDQGKEVVQIGEGPNASFVITAKALREASAPFFKDGKWQGKDEPFRLDKAQINIANYVEIGTPKQAYEDSTPEQQVVICVPSLGKTSLAWVGNAMQMALPVAMTRFLCLTIGKEVAKAREDLIDAVLSMPRRPAYMLFYGDDMLPQSNSALLLWETMKKLNSATACGLYTMKHHPPTRYLMWNNNEPGLFVPGRDFEVGDQVYCDGTGLDFCWIKTDYLAKMTKPRFRTGDEWVEGKGVMTYTEDAYFWRKFAEQAGHRPLVDTRAKIGHFNHFDGGVY